MKVSHDLVTCYVLRPDEAGISHEFLQLRRAAGDYMGGSWHTVSGSIEASETAVQAGIRELWEETGLAPNELYQLSSINSCYIAQFDTIFHSVTFVAFVDRSAEVRLNEEHDSSRWVARASIQQNLLWPGERRMVEELCREILDGSKAKEFLRVQT